MDFGLSFIRRLRPCHWRYKAPLDDGRKHLGFIAQEVAKLDPDQEFNFVVPGQDGLLGLNLYEFIGPIVKAIQELDERITKLEEKE